MKTIICANYQNEMILSEGVAAGSVNRGTRTLQLNSIFRRRPENDNILAFILSAKLREDTEGYPNYRNMFVYPAFLAEILRFARECALFGIEADELPGDTVLAGELKKIIRTALSLPLSEKESARSVDAGMKKLRDKGDVSIWPYFEKDIWNYRILKKLKGTFPPASVQDYTPAKYLKHSATSRTEIEAAAQDICLKGVPCTVILTNMASQLPVVREVFGRYGIPFSAIQEELHVHVVDIYTALAIFALDKDIDSFLDAVRKDAFPKVCNDRVLAFMEQTMDCLEIDENVVPLLEKSIFNKEAEKAGRLQLQTKAWLDSVSEETDLLLSAENSTDALKKAFAVLQKSPYLKDRKELYAAMKIRSFLSETLPLIRNDDDVSFILGSISLMSFRANDSKTDFCTVTDLTHPVPAKDTAYVIGCSGQDYPGYKGASGLFDEVYLQKVEKYPDADERYTAYMEQLEWIMGSAKKELVFSCSDTDYEGREIQLAFEIESQFDGKAEQWKLLKLRPGERKPALITKETARELFAPQGYIYGSISTIERWFQCGYSYFIQSGLKLRGPESTNLDAAPIGTIQHAVMENALNRYRKHYAEIPDDEVDGFLRDCFSAIASLHPREKHMFEMTRIRMAEGLRHSLAVLRDFETCTSFIPERAEEKFDTYITGNVKLRGTIDRVDRYKDEMLRIIDYKSSIHALTPAKFNAGLLLQLPSYAMIAEKVFGMKIAGTYYFSMQDNAFEAEAAKASKELVETDFSEEELFSRMIKARMLKGWTFLDRFTELDDGESHISLKKNLYDFEAVKQCLTEIYDHFSLNVLNGNIPIEPAEGACTFCDYRSVCMFHGPYRKPEPVTVLKKGGSDES